MVEITNKQEAEAWFRTRSPKEIARLAARIAARVLPQTMDVNRSGFEVELVAARAILAAATCEMYATDGFRKIAGGAANAGYSIHLTPAEAPQRQAARVTAHAAVAAAANTSAAAAGAAADAVDTYSIYAAYAALSKDASSVEAGERLLALWPDGASLDWAEDWGRLRARWAAEAPHYDFWIDWYEGLLEGREPDWPLWHDIIALIGNEVWAAGPEAVAREIERIRTEHALRREVRALRAQLAQQSADVRRRSHNNPPELVDETEAVIGTFGEVGAALDAIEAELDARERLAGRLRALATHMVGFAWVLASYAGRKLDKGIDKSVETVAVEGTRWAIRLTAGYWAAHYAAQTEPVARGINAIIELLSKLAALI